MSTSTEQWVRATSAAYAVPPHPHPKSLFPTSPKSPPPHPTPGAKCPHSSCPPTGCRHPSVRLFQSAKRPAALNFRADIGLLAFPDTPSTATPTPRRYPQGLGIGLRPRSASTVHSGATPTPTALNGRVRTMSAISPSPSYLLGASGERGGTGGARGGGAPPHPSHLSHPLDPDQPLDSPHPLELSGQAWRAGADRDPPFQDSPEWSQERDRQERQASYMSVDHGGGVRTRPASVVGGSAGFGSHVRDASGVRSASPVITNHWHARESTGTRSSSYNVPRERDQDRHSREPSVSLSTGYGHGQPPAHVGSAAEGVRSTSSTYGPVHVREGFSSASRRCPPPSIGYRRPSQTAAFGYGRDHHSQHAHVHEAHHPHAPPATIVDDDYWTEGDFELVSCDGVRFRIPSYYLFSASAVFREAGLDTSVSLSSPEDVDRLVDDTSSYASPASALPGVVHARYLRLCENTETAAVVRLFLSFASSGHLPIPDDGTTLDSLEALGALVSLLTKYECKATLALVLTVLREAVRQPSSVSPLAAFIAGATAGDALTCSVALDVTDWTWRMMDRHDLPASSDANVFDPHHMPVAVWQLIPPMYTWALTTAWSGADDGRTGPSFVRRLSWMRQVATNWA